MAELEQAFAQLLQALGNAQVPDPFPGPITGVSLGQPDPRLAQVDPLSAFGRGAPRRGEDIQPPMDIGKLIEELALATAGGGVDSGLGLPTENVNSQLSQASDVSSLLQGLVERFKTQVQVGGGEILGDFQEGAASLREGFNNIDQQIVDFVNKHRPGGSREESITGALAGPVLPPVAPEIPVASEATNSFADVAIPSSGSSILGEAVPGFGELNLPPVPSRPTDARDAAQAEIDALLTSLEGTDDRTPPTFLEKFRTFISGANRGAAGVNAVGSGGFARVLAGAGAGVSQAQTVAKEDEEEYQEALKTQKLSIDKLRLNLKLRDAGKIDDGEFIRAQLQHEQDSAVAQFEARTLEGQAPEVGLTPTGTITTQRLPDGRVKMQLEGNLDILADTLFKNQLITQRQGRGTGSTKPLKINFAGYFPNDPEGRASAGVLNKLIIDSEFGPQVEEITSATLQQELGSDLFEITQQTDPEGLQSLKKDKSKKLVLFLTSEVAKLRKDPGLAQFSDEDLIRVVLGAAKQESQGQ